jgi:hypothetical protein
LGIFAARCYKDASPTGLKTIRVNSPAATGASTAGEIRVKKIRVQSVFHPAFAPLRRGKPWLN